MKQSIVRMKVAQKAREKQRNRIVRETDKNYQFLQLIDHFPFEKKKMINSPLITALPKVIQKVSEIDKCEQIQWSHVKTLSIKHLFTRINQIEQSLPFEVDSSTTQLLKEPMKAFRDNIRILVNVCTDLQIPYDSSSVEQMIKRFYYSEYKDEVLPFFCAVDYQSSKYHILPERKRPFLECCKPKDIVNIK